MVTKKEFLSDLKIQSELLHKTEKDFFLSLAYMYDMLTLTVAEVMEYHKNNCKSPIEHEEGLNGRSIYKIQKITQSFYDLLSKKRLSEASQLFNNIKEDFTRFSEEVKFYFPDDKTL